MAKATIEKTRKTKQKEKGGKKNQQGSRLFGCGRMGNKMCNRKTCKSCVVTTWFTLVVKEVKYCFHENFQTCL
jgi:hypothetical protein